MNWKTLSGAAALLLACSSAFAHDYRAGEIHIDHPWSRAMPSTAPTAAVYFTLENMGPTEDTLVGASTPVAVRAELHEHVRAGDGMRMQHVESVALPAGQSVKFAPMGYHVMLFDVQQQAEAGAHFPLTLEFAKAGKVQVEVAVEEVGGAAEHQGHGKQLDGMQHH